MLWNWWSLLWRPWQNLPLRLWKEFQDDNSVALFQSIQPHCIANWFRGLKISQPIAPFFHVHTVEIIAIKWIKRFFDLNNNKFYLSFWRTFNICWMGKWENLEISSILSSNLNDWIISIKPIQRNQIRQTMFELLHNLSHLMERYDSDTSG